MFKVEDGESGARVEAVNILRAQVFEVTSDRVSLDIEGSAEPLNIVAKQLERHAFLKELRPGALVSVSMTADMMPRICTISQLGDYY